MSYSLDFQEVLSYSFDFLTGAALTLKLSLSSILVATTLAIPSAWCKVHGPLLLQKLISVYVETFRNTPLLVQIYLIFFAFPAMGIRLSPNVAALIALSLNLGAYLIEIIRTGLQSIDRGQIEAGRALGLNEKHIFLNIVLRPTIKVIYPALTSQFIILLLFSSLVSAVSADELTSIANHVQSITFQSFEVYILVTGIYLFLSLSLSLIFSVFYKAFITYPVS